MSEHFIKYGDKKIPMPAEMKLEQAKEIMARHFPELAEPKVETKKEGDATVYVFTKQMGRKGAGSRPTAKLAARLARLKAVAPVAPEIVALFEQAKFVRGRASAADIELPAAASVLALPKRGDERAAIGQTRRNLLQLTPEANDDDVILL